MLLKERASALGHLMVGAHLGSKPYEFNTTEKKRWEQIQENLKSEKKLTPKMSEDLTKLEVLKKTIIKPTLSKGAKTHIENKWLADYFDFQKYFSNKFTRNGNEQEQKAINEVAKLLGFKFAVKNEKHFENDWTHGTPDWINPIFPTDTKCVYEPHGLDFGQPLDAIYEWQKKDYLWLLGKERGLVAKVLLNKSEKIIRHEAKSLWVESSPDNHWSDEVPEYFINDVRDMYDFESKRPIEDRVNLYEVILTDNDIELIKQQIELSREYWNEINQNPRRFNEELINKYRV